MRRASLDSPAAGGSILGSMESLETRDLMPIGRFARQTGLSVKALRHYDEVGLLRPAAVDPGTGYRSYSAAQVEPAETIRLLRRLVNGHAQGFFPAFTDHAATSRARGSTFWREQYRRPGS